MLKRYRWLKWIGRLLFFIIVVVPLCNCCSFFTIGIHILEIPIHLKLFYGGAHFVERVSPACGSSEVWPEYVYWWTSDNLDTIRQYYEKTLPKFKVSDDHQMASTSFENNPFVPIPFLLPPFADYINPATLYHDVTINLFSLGQPDLQKRAQPGWCYFEPDNPLYDFLKSPPSKGTLIVYSYDTWVP